MPIDKSMSHILTEIYLNGASVDRKGCDESISQALSQIRQKLEGKKKYRIKCYQCNGKGYMYFPTKAIAKVVNCYKGSAVIPYTGIKHMIEELPQKRRK